MSLADHLEKKGIEKGLKQGLKQGVQEGQSALVQRQLQRRFGPLPPDALERVRRAAPSELELWADRVLTAATLAEVLDGAP